MRRRQFIKNAAGLMVPAVFAPNIIKAQSFSRTAAFKAAAANQAAGPTAPPYVPNAVEFDGTNDWMLRGAGLTGAADGKKGIVSFWVKFTADYTTFAFILDGNYPAGGNGLFIYRAAGYQMYIDGYNAAGAAVFNASSVGGQPFNVAAGWQHFMCSWDLAIGAYGMYVDGVSQGSALMLTNDSIDYTQANWAIGGSTAPGSFMVQACVADLYVNLAENIDLSDAGNRAKFYSAGGAPVDLGSDGSTPTGTAPIIFMKGNAAGFNVNSGTGGNFTTTGTLTTCSDGPP